MLEALTGSDPLRISFDGIRLDTVAQLDDQESESITVFSLSMRGTVLAIPAATICASDAAAAIIIAPLLAAVRATRPELIPVIVADHKAIEGFLPYGGINTCRLCRNGLQAPPGAPFLFGGAHPDPAPTLDGCYVAPALKHTFGTVLYRLSCSVAFDLDGRLQELSVRDAVKDGRPSMKGTKFLLGGNAELPADVECLRTMWRALMHRDDVAAAAVALQVVHRTILRAGGVFSKGCHAAYDMLATIDTLGVYSVDDEALERACQMMKRQFCSRNRDVRRALAEANYLLHI